MVEISIVLVIIGLLVGGILVGHEMIRAAEVRSVISDVEKIRTAVNTFKMRYNCLPGDCGNAGNLGLGTSGNGNGVVDEGWCYLPQDTSNAGNVELYRFWLHLANANLFPGSFTGTAGAGNAITSVINTNVPASRFPGGGYSIMNMMPGGGCAFFPNANYSNIIVFGAQISASPTAGPLLTPAEASSIDQKVDDGMPGTGRVLTLNNSWYISAGYGSGNCVTSDLVTATYALTYKGRGCSLNFSQVF